jgi:hypothetical protein
MRRRILTFIAVVALLLAMSQAMDPVFGQPDTTCMPSRDWRFFGPPASCGWWSN